MTQIHQHDHPKLCRHPGQGDKPGAGCDRHMEALPVQEPYPADQRERQAHQDQQRLIHATERQIEQNEDDHHRHRHHQLQLLIGMLKQFKLSGEGHAGSRPQFYVLADGRLNVVHHGHHIPASGIDIDPARRAGIFRFQHRWA